MSSGSRLRCGHVCLFLFRFFKLLEQNKLLFLDDHQLKIAMFALKATWSTTPWLLLVRSTRGHFFDVEKRASEPLYQASRTLSSLIKNKFTFALKKDLPEELLEATDGQLKPRRHPGARRRTVRTDELPIKLQLAATNILNSR